MLPRILALAMRLPPLRRFAFRTVSQIGIRYPDSPLSVAAGALRRGAPRPGDRFPWMQLEFSPGGPVEDLFTRLDDTRFNLILVGQAAPADRSDHGGLVLTHAIPADPHNDRALRRAKIPNPSYYLLRPDGHVGLAGVRADAATLARYFAACFIGV